jgi:hypothetical protein
VRDAERARLEKTSEGLQSPFLQFPSRWRLLFLRLQGRGTSNKRKARDSKLFSLQRLSRIRTCSAFYSPQCSKAPLIRFQSLCSLCPLFHDPSEKVVPDQACDITCRISGFSLLSLHITLLFFLHYLSRERFESFQMVALFVRYFSFQFDRFAQGD